MKFPFLRSALLAMVVIASAALTVRFFTPKPAHAEPFVTPEQLDVKNAAVTQCTMEQNVPVMGFNLKVVCLEPNGKIAWTR